MRNRERGTHTERECVYLYVPCKELTRICAPTHTRVQIRNKSAYLMGCINKRKVPTPTNLDGLASIPAGLFGYVCMYLCMYVCKYKQKDGLASIPAGLFVYVCMYVCMHVCMYVCIACIQMIQDRHTSTEINAFLPYIYTYIHTYTHGHIHKHTYKHCDTHMIQEK